MNAPLAGEDCSKPVCPNSCSGNGACNATSGTCDCSQGFYGGACDIKGCHNDCSGHGMCHEQQCICYDGFEGVWCESETGCPNQCNKRGRCFQHACYCEEGFSGPGCELVTCPDNCNGRGKCNSTSGVCACEDKFAGPGCERLRCPGDCSDHGFCDSTTGVCKCYPGFYGADCAPSNCPLDCSGRGKCVKNEVTGKSECECDKNHVGEGCELETCPNGCNADSKKVGECSVRVAVQVSFARSLPGYLHVRRLPVRGQLDWRRLLQATLPGRLHRPDARLLRHVRLPLRVHERMDGTQLPAAALPRRVQLPRHLQQRHMPLQRLVDGRQVRGVCATVPRRTHAPLTAAGQQTPTCARGPNGDLCFGHGDCIVPAVFDSPKAALLAALADSADPHKMAASALRRLGARSKVLHARTRRSWRGAMSSSPPRADWKVSVQAGLGGARLLAARLPERLQRCRRGGVRFAGAALG
jgi:hypothetical protein